LENWLVVAALGRRREAQQLPRREMLQERLVGRRCGVMELVDDHDIEMVRRDVVWAANTEALNRGEHVLEAVRSLASYPPLAECRIAKRMAECGQALVENLFSVCDEQEAGAGQATAQTLIVQGGHHGLARAGCRNQQVPMVALEAGELDQLQESGLKWLRPDFDRAEVDLRTLAPHLGELAKLLRLERPEVGVLPIALEYRGKLVDNIGIARARHADIPFKTCDLGRIGQVRRADIRSGVPGVAVEQPGLGV